MEWVQKMSDAMRSLNYRGNFVYMHEDQLESMEISHVRDSLGEKERLISLNGEAREVLRDNENLTCIWPSSQKVVVDYSRKNSFSPISVPEDIARVEQFYNINLLGNDRIAGKSTVIVHIQPKDDYRYGIKFWINEQNGLMMKSSLIDEGSREVEQVMFTSLDLLEKNTDLMLETIPELEDQYTLIRNHVGERQQDGVVDVSWKLDDVPLGFQRKSLVSRKIQGTEQYVQQMVYTDGLASISVFIEKEIEQIPQGGTSMGAVNAYIRVLGDYSITAIGEVPAMTVRKLAESVYYQN